MIHSCQIFLDNFIFLACRANFAVLTYLNFDIFKTALFVVHFYEYKIRERLNKSAMTNVKMYTSVKLKNFVNLETYQDHTDQMTT